MSNVFMFLIGAEFFLSSIFYLIDGNGIKSLYCFSAALIQLTIIYMK